MVSWLLTRPIFFAEGENPGGSDGGETAPEAGGGSAAGAPESGETSGANVFTDAAARAAAASAEGGEAGDAGGDGGDAGERPEHIPEQFWRDGSLDDVAIVKSWSDSQQYIKTLRAQQGLTPPENPDAYEVALPEGVQVPSDDKMLGAFKAASHKAGLSQQMFNDLLQPVLTTMQELQPRKLSEEEANAALEKTFGEFGGKEKAQQLVDVNYQYYMGLADKGVVERAVVEEAMGELGLTPGGLRLMNTMRELAGEKPMPLNPARETGAMTRDELAALVASPEYQRGDPATLAKADHQFKLLYGQEPSGSGAPGGVSAPIPAHLRALHKQQ